MKSKKINANKKALSNVVAVLLITLISVTAVSVLYSQLRPILSPEKALAPAFSCFDFKLNQPVTIQNACFNSETRKFEISLSQKQDISSHSLKFSFIQENNGEEWLCGGLCSSCIINSNSSNSVYYLPLDNIPFNAENSPKLLLSISGCQIDSRQLSIC